MTKFNNRSTYLAFRKEWKINYAELTLEIRTTRAAIKAAYEAGDRARASSLQSHKQYLRDDARNALQTLAEAKIEAQRQYMAERETRDNIAA